MAQAGGARFGFLETVGFDGRLWDAAFGLVLPAVLVSGWALDEALSARAAARFAHPVHLEHQSAERPASNDDVAEARLLSGQGLPFGYASQLQLPDGQIITCVERFINVRCDSGWRLAVARGSRPSI